MDDMKRIVKLPPFTVKTMVSILSEVQDYNLRLMNIPEIWKRTMGEGIKVVVLDTGVPQHVDIRIAGGKGFIKADPSYGLDANGHASHVAGSIAAIANNNQGIAGIAPKCELWCGAVLNQDGTGTIEDIISGIRWAVEEVGANVINMSLGMGARPRIRELETECIRARDKGVVIVCASGNEGGQVGQPAIYDSVIACAAVDGSKKKAYFSNFGTELDFATGGVDVYSTYLNNSYCKMSGTSMASPVLAGVVALIMSDGKNKTGKMLTPAEVYIKLQKIAYDLGDSGFDEQYGWGIPVFRKEDVALIPSQPIPQPIQSPVYVPPVRPVVKQWWQFWKWFK